MNEDLVAKADFPADEKYMRRALALALNGKGFASPNPMVGAVIVAPDGRIIGEGWHRRCGSGHAEVNAVASVSEADRPLLKESTMYVTLEPCSHYGKTPPCAKLIIETGIPRVVVAAVDPFVKVAGRGIAMLREAGVEVMVGMLDEESRRLNRRFMTAHNLRRPFITLKWAQSIDGWMDWERTDEHPEAYRFSSPETSVGTMRLRANHDAILTTSETVLRDNSRLTIRGWDGVQPVRVVLDRSKRLTGTEAVFAHVKGYDDRNRAETIVMEQSDIAQALHQLYAKGITSVLVEAGSTLLNEFIARGLWDAARVETAPVVLGAAGRVAAPHLPAECLTDVVADFVPYAAVDSSGRQPSPDSYGPNLLRFYFNQAPK